MKKILIIASCILSVTVFAKDLSSKKELFSDIKEETKKCAVHVATSDTSVVTYKSTCNTLVIVSNIEARLLIDGEWIVATIKESAESDGGDLDDLVITDSNGKILATKTNVPAYDSVIVAMAGDDLDNDLNK